MGRSGLPQRIEKGTLGGAIRHVTWIAAVLSGNPAIDLQGFPDTGYDRIAW
jgi:hypothetical protein